MLTAAAVFTQLSASVILLVAVYLKLPGFLPFFILSAVSAVCWLMAQRLYWFISWLALGGMIVLLFWQNESLIIGQQPEGLLFYLQIFQILVVFGGLIAIQRHCQVPYFDRRSHGWSSPATRYSLMTPMIFPEHSGLVGQTMNLSVSGARVSFDVNLKVPFAQDQAVWFSLPEVGDYLLQGRVVEIDGPFMRLEFQPLTEEYQAKLERYLSLRPHFSALDGNASDDDVNIDDFEEINDKN